MSGLRFWSAFKRRTGAAPKPRVVQAVSYFPPHLGGMENVAKEMSAQLAEDGWQVDVITSTIGMGARGKRKKARKEAYTVHRLKSIEIAHTPIMPGLLLKLLRVKKPAVIHLHLAQAYLPETVWFVSRLRRIPYIVHFHLDVEPSGRFGFFFVLYKKHIQPIVMRDAAYVIALSPEQRLMVIERYKLSPEKVKFIPNGVSDEFLKIGKAQRTPHNPLRLLFVGRLATQKRVDRLIEAMSLLKDDMRNVRLTIVGDGEDASDLKAMTKLLKLDESVEFVGAKYGDAVTDAYREADVFILPSDREGMPLVLFEAMAAGLPVIASNVQGIREHLTGVGILVKKLTPKKFAVAIDYLHENLDAFYPALSRASYEKASQQSWQELTTKIEKLYVKTAEKRPSRQLGRLGLFSVVIVWWLAFLGLRLVHGMPEYITNAVGFSFLVVVPGMLSVIGLRLRIVEWGKFALAIGFSVLELMFIALVGNTVLQWFNVARPLDARILIPEISLLLLALIIFAWRRMGNWHVTLGFSSVLRTLLPTGRDRFVALFPIVFIALSVLGANSLNNGGTDVFTMAMLVAIALFSLYLFAVARKLTDNTIATAIFLTSIAVLFMNSLRGWYTTGHDIQLEYWVFQLTKAHGVWHIQDFRNPYNACLSITILPTVFANLLKLFDPYVYKIFFQILFATCPAIIYLFFRRWVTAAIAFLSAFYFIAFPTFFTDMSFLNRQEIAFIFFALMLFIIFQDEVKIKLRRAIFLVMGVGLVLSHYSTTYSVIAILLLSIMTLPILRIAGRKAMKYRAFRASALKVVHSEVNEVKRITLVMVLVLTCASILWTIILTNTGGNTGAVVAQTIDTIGQSFKQDAPRSNTTNYSLLSYAANSPSQELDKYIATSVDPLRSSSPDSYYSTSAYTKYPITVTTDAVQPITRLGNKLSTLGLNITSLNFTVRQATAKLLQVLVIAGFIYILFRKTYSRLLDSDYIGLCVGSIIFVALQVVLPILSVQYGLLRAFQQSLMLLGLLTVLGSIALFVWIPNTVLRMAGPALLAVLFFLSSTGVFSQATGGYYAQLNLSNSGVYYNSYYTHAQDIAGIEWLNGVAGKTVNGKFVGAPLDIESYTYNELAVYTPLIPTGDIFPGLVRHDAYVFLGYSNVVQDQATVSYNNDLITYKYPLQFLNNQKDLIYSNGDTDIYR